jgi:excisionase family DNA binding protein
MTLQELLLIRGVEDRPLFRIADICTLFEVRRVTVSRWIMRGKLQALKINGKTRFIPRASVEALVSQEMA